MFAQRWITEFWASKGFSVWPDSRRHPTKCKFAATFTEKQDVCFFFPDVLTLVQLNEHFIFVLQLTSGANLEALASSAQILTSNPENLESENITTAAQIANMLLLFPNATEVWAITDEEEKTPLVQPDSCQVLVWPNQKVKVMFPVCRMSGWQRWLQSVSCSTPARRVIRRKTTQHWSKQTDLYVMS